MKKNLIISFVLILAFLGLNLGGIVSANPPSFEKDFVSSLSTGDSRVYNPTEKKDDKFL
jgi:hypothetical protein